MYGSPVHIAGERPRGEIIVSPSVSVNEPSTLRLSTRDASHEEGDTEIIDWVVPRLEGGVGIDLAITDRTALSGAMSMGRADGWLSWAAEGSIGRLWLTRDGPAFRLDLGTRVRRSEFDVVYDELDSTSTIPGRVSGSRTHWDAYTTLTASAPSGEHAVDWHMVLEAGLVTYLDHLLVGEFSAYNHERRGGLLAINVGLSRPLRSQRRLLGGVRYVSIDGDDAVVQLYTQVDFLFNGR